MVDQLLPIKPRSSGVRRFCWSLGIQANGTVLQPCDVSSSLSHQVKSQRLIPFSSRFAYLLGKCLYIGGRPGFVPLPALSPDVPPNLVPSYPDSPTSSPSPSSLSPPSSSSSSPCSSPPPRPSKRSSKSYTESSPSRAGSSKTKSPTFGARSTSSSNYGNGLTAPRSRDSPSC